MPYLLVSLLRRRGGGRAERDPPFVGCRLLGVVREALMLQHIIERDRLKRGDQQQFLFCVELPNRLHDFGEGVLSLGKIGANI